MASLVGMTALPAIAAPARDFSGSWTIALQTPDDSTAATLQLERKGDGYAGRSDPLDIAAACPLTYEGAATGERLRLKVLCRDREVGTLELAPARDGLAGRGTLFGTPVTYSAQRVVTPAEQAPRTLEYDPPAFHPLTSAAPPPALRVRSGDKVKTRTVDSSGVDEHGNPASMPGNPGTGPFYVEGAMPGDTVALHFSRIAINRSTARMKIALDPASVMPGHAQSPGAMKDPTWALDLGRQTASLQSPSERLKRFKRPVRPMLGVVSVAPAGFSVLNRELGEWGGNLDYNEIRDGVTLYLPVYRQGALIFMGDGHALQGAGEITGQGLETSLSVEFEVTLLKGQSFPHPAGFPPLGPWAENAEYIMVSGIGGDVTDALRRATTSLSLWLTQRYGLDDSEVAAVLGSSIEYDVAEVISAKAHVVAKLRKDILGMLEPLAH